MANLRKISKNKNTHRDDDNDDDVEAMSLTSSSSINEKKKLLIVSKSPGGSDDDDSHRPFSSTTSSSHSNLRQKVLSLLIDDDSTNDNNNINHHRPLPWGKSILSLLRDIFIGSILGFITISLLLFLDHRNVIHIQSAHNFRKATLQVLQDPDTMAFMETEFDLKFIPVNYYNTTKMEIEKAVQDQERYQKVLDERSMEENEKQKILKTLTEEYHTLLSNSRLGLDKFCGTCKWQGKVTCDARVNYLMDKYGDTLHKAKLALLENSACQST